VNEPEEAPNAKKWVTELLKNGARQNQLAAFRIDDNFDRGYWPEDYLSEFCRAGGKIESIVTLGQPTPDWVPALGSPYGQIVESGLPTNAMAERIRAMWGWV
jgi:hypothetical protein